MRYLIKNKTSKNIVLLVDGGTHYLLPKGDGKGRDCLLVGSLTPQLKNAKMLRFIQITKVERTKEAD
jgi:hypothetical protein